MTGRQPTFFGWRVVGAAFVVAVFSWGISFYGPPIFLQVLHASRGWPIALISLGITAHFLLGALVVANLAALHRRFGVVTVTRAGGVLTAIGLCGWAFAREPWQLFLAMPISGAGWAMTSGAALNAMVAPWFAVRRAAALSMAFNGASLGGVVFSPLLVALIRWLGFPEAALLIAVTVVLVTWCLAGRYLGRDPAAMGLLVDGTPPPPSAVPSLSTVPVRIAAAPVPNPWRDRRFLTLAAAATLGLFAQIGLVAHLFSLLAPTLGESGAGAAMGAATACAICGRSLLSIAMPEDADRRKVAAANLIVQAVGSIVLLCAGASVPLLLFGCALFGLGLGNVTSLPPLIAQADFCPADASRVVGLITATSQAGYAFAPAAFGLLRGLGDVSTASASVLFATAAAIQLAAAGMVVLGPRRAAYAADICIS
ncbi:MAG TPA: MFS transporter [Rhodopila sp.]|nr:MFS transporter [Rhodopila sp.]